MRNWCSPCQKELSWAKCMSCPPNVPFNQNLTPPHTELCLNSCLVLWKCSGLRWHGKTQLGPAHSFSNATPFTQTPISRLSPLLMDFLHSKLPLNLSSPPLIHMLQCTTVQTSFPLELWIVNYTFTRSQCIRILENRPNMRPRNQIHWSEAKSKVALISRLEIPIRTNPVHL